MWGAVPPLGFARRVLPNGLEVYTARDADTSNVTVQVWYKVGSKDDLRLMVTGARGSAAMSV